MELENLIEGRGVSKVFKDFWGRPKVQAVSDLDITVRRGSVFGLLGPNGAGKSTLMKMLLGHLYPSAGTLTVLGKHPTDVDAKARIGYMPEKTTLYKHLTPLQTLKFFGQILELPADIIRNRSDQLLDMVGLAHAKDRIVGEFSHGMGRRMGLAQALLNDPDLLLLDEPTAGLDPLGCREVKDLILTLAKRGKTIVLTSHLLADVEEVSDELMIIYGGKVQAVGRAKELLAHKDILQVTIPAVGDGLKMRLLDAVSGDVQADEVEFSNPSRSLENFFLEVVREAGSKQETFGARAGKGVAGYLQAERDAAPTPIKPDEIAEPAPPREAEDHKAEPLQPSPEPKVEEPESDRDKPPAQQPEEPPPADMSVSMGDAVSPVEPEKPGIETGLSGFDNIRVMSDGGETSPPVTEEPQSDENDDEIDQDLLDSLTK